MADPLALLILENVKSTLEGITVANDYHRNVRLVTFQGPLNWRTDPDAIYIYPPSSLAATHAPVAYTTVEMALTLGCLVHDTNDTLAAMLKLSSDVVTALEGSRTRGGYAIDTVVTNQFTQPFLAMDDPTRGAFAMMATVQYDHVKTDPDTQVGG